MGLFDRLRRGHAPTAEPEPETPERTVVEIDATSLSRVFSAPMWLRDLGLLAWFLVGVAILLVGLTWLLGLTSTITMPVIVGAILATVAGPLVTKMQQHRIPRPAGAALVLLGLIALGIVIFLMVVGGLVEQSSEIKRSLNEAVDKIQGWVNDTGANGTSGVTESAKSGTTTSGKELIQGLGAGIKDLTSLIFFVTFSAFATFFLLKDGPSVRNFIDRHLGVPAEVATVITGNVIKSLRRYFLGVTIVAAFNAFVIGLTAIILGVPLAGTIAVVVFVTAYVPFIGAFISGAFAVLLTLSSQGTTSAADHARDGHPRERAAPEHRAADRLRGHARPEPARRPDRDDRLRQHLRDGRPGAGGAAHVGGAAHHPGAGRGESCGSGTSSATGERARPGGLNAEAGAVMRLLGGD